MKHKFPETVYAAVNEGWDENDPPTFDYHADIYKIAKRDATTLVGVYRLVGQRLASNTTTLVVEPNQP